MTTNDQARILTILAEAKDLAREYRQLTGKPLGITGEVAEYEAAQKLGVTLTPARHAGYDAVRDSDGRTYQIKGRCLLPGCKPGQRIGRIDVGKAFDAVLLDEHFRRYRDLRGRSCARTGRSRGARIEVPQRTRGAVAIQV